MLLDLSDDRRMKTWIRPIATAADIERIMATLRAHDYEFIDGFDDCVRALPCAESPHAEQIRERLGCEREEGRMLLCFSTRKWHLGGVILGSIGRIHHIWIRQMLRRQGLGRILHDNFIASLPFAATALLSASRESLGFWVRLGYEACDDELNDDKENATNTAPSLVPMRRLSSSLAAPVRQEDERQVAAQW